MEGENVGSFSLRILDPYIIFLYINPSSQTSFKLFQIV